MTTTTDLLAQLVGIDSRNPQLDTQGPGETAIAAVATTVPRAIRRRVSRVEREPELLPAR